MTTRNFRYLFQPESVALIGASRRQGSVGAVIASNLLRGGLAGPVLPVNPNYQSVEGVLCYPDVAALPLAPDLAVIATPAPVVPELLVELAARGTRAAVIITAGFGEVAGEGGAGLQQALLDAAKPSLVRLVGPNTVGILAPNHGLNASFAHLAPEPGHLAFVSQSGAVITAVIDWAKPRGIGFSHLVSLGGMLDVDVGDMLDYLANDEQTHAILLHLEGARHGRKFLSAGRAAARTKPVLVVKTGRHPQSAKAAATHTGALAGADDVYDAVFRRAGMLRVNDLESLFTAVETLADLKPPRGKRLGIVTNGGGLGVLAADELLSRGGELASLSNDAVAALDGVLPANWSKQNPVDIIGDAPPERTGDAVRVLLEHADGLDALLVLNCPTAVAAPRECAQALVAALEDGASIPVLTSWVGEATADAGRQVLNAHHLATYDSPGPAVAAFMQLVDYQRGQELLREVSPPAPDSFEADRGRARAIVAAALRDAAETWLPEVEAKELLAAYGVPVTPTRFARTPEQAGELAAAMAGAVVLKIVSPDIVHKSDLGGVLLDLSGAEAVTAAAQRMQARISAAQPQARLEGFTVQPMERRSDSHELIVGVTVDSQFGPVLLFGEGGTAVELIRDRSLELPPLNERLALNMIARTRIHRRLEGYRGRPAADVGALARILIRVARLVIDVPEVVSLDINPLLADSTGAVALDARVRLGRAGPDSANRLAIRPYPGELEQSLTLPDGRVRLLRPVLPGDEQVIRAAFAGQVEEQILVARITQIDFDREMVLVATETGPAGAVPVYGVARLLSDPENRTAEISLLIPRGDGGDTLNAGLLDAIVRYAGTRGLAEVWIRVALADPVVRSLCVDAGFSELPATQPDEFSRWHLRLLA
ncbi:MAG: acetate--CoA ligase family protein [Pseudomonadales bacterium]